MKDTPAFKFITSLWITVTLLTLALFIIFFGTMAQEPMGLNIAVDRYFKSWFIDQVAMQAGVTKTAQLFGAQWTPVSPGEILGNPGLPVFPGGYLVGTLLLLNLMASYYVRFEWSARKAGIFCSHLGIITLLLSQLFTDIFQVESFVSMERGDRRNFTVSFDDQELVFMLGITNGDGHVVSNRVVSIPEEALKGNELVAHPRLEGLKIQTLKYWVNAKPMTAVQLIEWDSEQQKALEKTVRGQFYELINTRIARMEEWLASHPNAPEHDQQRKSLTVLKGIFFEARSQLMGSQQLEGFQGAVGKMELEIFGYRENDPKLFGNDQRAKKLLEKVSGHEEQRAFSNVFSERLKEQLHEGTLEEFNQQTDSFVEKVKNFPGGLSPELLKSTEGFARRIKAKAKLYHTGTSHGRLGRHFRFVRPLQAAFSQNDRNLPAAIIKISHKNNDMGTWLVSGSNDFQQSLKVDGDSWKINLRAKRHYLDFHLTLVDLKWEKYSGTEIPKNFQSRIIVEGDGEPRAVDIYMNNPLRQGGQTFYQYQMNQNQLGDSVQTMLQVVKNPNWRTAYIGCLIVACGLMYQFIFHLVGFARKRRKADA